jgi:hypothetical protein
LVIAHGELLLISVAILGDTIERAASRVENRLLRTVLMLGSVTVLIVMIYYIGELRTRIAELPVTQIASNNSGGILNVPRIDSFLGRRIIADSLKGFAAAFLLNFITVLAEEE